MAAFAVTNPSAKEMGFSVFSLSLRSAQIRRCAAFLFCIPVLIAVVHGLSGHESMCRDPTDSVVCRVEEMKLKVTQLESILEGNTRSLSAKHAYFKEKEKQVEEMTQELRFLENAIANMKTSQDDYYYQERVQKLEEEVRLLWAESRKNNFNIHVLEAKAHDSEDKLAELASEVEKMQSIVTEQWIQIQQLEQALQIIEFRKRESSCTFLKFIKNFNGQHLQKMIRLGPRFFSSDSVLGSYTDQALHHLERIMSAAQKYHHQLQHTVKQTMERNEFTAALANNEVVFFVASALITFPVLSLWHLLLQLLS